MALKLTTNSSAPLWITPVFSDCEVYLDHWALRKISSTPELRVQFLEVIKKRSGGVQLSVINILEFSEVTDQKQVELAETFLNELSPNHIGFIDAIPKAVIDREDFLLRGEVPPIVPYADPKLINFFGSRRTGSLSLLDFRGLFTQAPRVQEMCKTFMNELGDVLSAAKEKAKDPYYSKIIAQAPPPNTAVQQLTRHINLLAARHLAHQSIKMKPNHWRDYFHMVVPTAYCDFVLLDSTWASIATQIQNRLRRRGHTAKMAEIFSPQTLDLFFARVAVS